MGPSSFIMELAGICPLIRLACARHLSLSPLAFGHLPLTRGVGPERGRLLEMRIPGHPREGKGARPKAVTDEVRAAQVCRPYGWNGFPTVGDRKGRPYGVSPRRFRTARPGGRALQRENPSKAGG